MHSFTPRLVTLVVALAAVATPGPSRAADGDAVTWRGPAITEPQRERNRNEQIERFTRTFKLGRSGQIDLGNIAGDITVTAGGADELSIEVVKRARGTSDADATEQLKLVDVEISERAGRVDVRTRYPGRDERSGRRSINVSVTYTVTAPAGTGVTARSISGDVSVTGIKGAVDAESVSGEIRIQQGVLVERAKSISGDVDIDGVSLDGTLEASSVSGDVRARNVKARRVELGSTSGDVEVSEVSCETADLRSTSGGVEYTGTFVKGGRYVFRSHSGNVRVAVAGDVGFELEASTFSGSIDSELPITIGGQSGSSRGASRRSVRGVYGDGSASVELTTFSGDVIIRKR